MTVRFAHPWFKTYDCNQFTGVICSDFEPAERCVYLARTWRGFDYYWPRFLDQWGSGQGKTGNVAFTLDGNTKVRYHVKTEYFVYGDKLFVDGKLNAHERMSTWWTGVADWVSTGDTAVGPIRSTSD